jgi:hypothetical protein
MQTFCPLFAKIDFITFQKTSEQNVSRVLTPQSNPVSTQKQNIELQNCVKGCRCDLLHYRLTGTGSQHKTKCQIWLQRGPQHGVIGTARWQQKVTLCKCKLWRV